MKEHLNQMSKIRENITGGDCWLVLQIRPDPFWKKLRLVGQVVIAMVIVITSVIGGFIWVHLIWLADVTVRLQVSGTITANCQIRLSD